MTSSEKQTFDDVWVRDNLPKVFNLLQEIKETNDIEAQRLAIEAIFGVRLKYPSQSKFPQIKFDFNEDDINTLSDPDFSLSQAGDNLKTHLEKLMYAVLWKNGDLGKEVHIIKGLLGKEDLQKKDSGPVFYSFGRHLKNRRRPIVDQHVIRAFLLGRNGDIAAIRRSDKVRKEDIDSYLNWHESTFGSFESRAVGREKITYEVDRILFAIGKLLKITKVN